MRTESSFTPEEAAVEKAREVDKEKRHQRKNISDN